MKHLETRPGIFSAGLGLMCVLTYLYCLWESLDISLIKSVLIQVDNGFILTSLGIAAAFTIVNKTINYTYRLKHKVIDEHEMSQAKHQDYDANMVLLFMYNMSDETIRSSVNSHLAQLEQSEKPSYIFLSINEGDETSREFLLTQSLVQGHNSTHPQFPKKLICLPQPDGLGKKHGAIVPGLLAMRLALLEICEELYPNNFDRVAAENIHTAEDLEEFIDQHPHIKILLHKVDGDTIVAPVEQINYFQEVANLLFVRVKSRFKRIALTTDNLAIVEKNHKLRTMTPKYLHWYVDFMDYIYLLYTKDIRYLDRDLNTGSTEIAPVLTGRSDNENALNLLCTGYIRAFQNSLWWKHGVYYESQTGDDKDSINFLLETKKEVSYVPLLAVYSVEEDIVKDKEGERWKNYVFGGIASVNIRILKNGMRLAESLAFSKRKLPKLLRLRFILQAYFYFTPLLGPTISYFSGVYYEGSWSLLNQGVLFWLFSSAILQMFERALKLLIRHKHYQRTLEEKIIDLMIFPQAAIFRRFLYLAIPIWKFIGKDTMDFTFWNRSNARSASIPKWELWCLRYPLVTLKLATLFLWTYVYVQWSV